MTVRVRFAPSPTGEPHIGNIRTVVFNWLFARKMGGRFILRIEDTDRTRYQPESIPIIMEGLRWLGLDWDEGPGLEELRRSGVENAEAYGVGGPHGPYVQSERLERYREVAEELVERGWAYRCNCSPERLERVRRMQRARKLPVMYDRHCRDLPPGAVSPDEPHVIRLKVPLTGQTVVHDVIKGDVVYDNAGIDDQVLLKSDGFPTYHLAVVVDDHDMRITHIIRADHWIPSTPKHILMYEALGWDIPTYCHVPLVLGEDGKPLAKRHGATSVTQFRDQGYLPEALFNFLALLGWAPGEGEEQEIFGREELIERFDLFRVNRAPATFSYSKLDWMNGVYIRGLSQDDLLERLIPVWQRAGLVPDPCPEDMRATLRRVVPLVQERLKRLTDVVDLTEFFFSEIEPPSAVLLMQKGLDAGQSLEVLRRARYVLTQVEDFSEERVEGVLRGLVEEMGLKNRQVFGVIRVATTGKKVSPPLFGTLSILGRQRVLARLEAAEAVLGVSSKS
ncbi:MAG TPA: glutamate--tRNA ligase [Anaerolineae bacterium]|nr:glutamate--tRNA ligase [Anaerolineae bacterium]